MLITCTLDELSVKSLVKSALLSILNELSDGKKSIVPANCSVNGSLSVDSASLSSLVESLHNFGTCKASSPLALN